MKTEFIGYYRPSPEEIKDLWDTCVFSVDANVLLDLYRYTPEARDAFLKTLEGVGNRLWITHQAALEYQVNRLEEIGNQADIYKKVTDIFEKSQKDLQALFTKGHISIDVSALLQKIEATFGEIEEDLKRQNEAHPNLLEDDEIRKRLTDFFKGRVGEAFTKEKLEEIYKLGEQRYENTIGPGFEDRKKEGSKIFGELIIKDKYGDLIIWFQLLELSKIQNRPLIFVTADRKADWWWKFKGKTIGPLPELIAEFKTRTTHPFYMYTSDRFIEYANTYFGLEVSQGVIDEVRDVTDSKVDWKTEVYSALVDLGRTAHLEDLYHYFETSSQRVLPTSYRSIIRKTLYHYSSDTDSFLGKEDLFERKGDGYWKIRGAFDQELSLSKKQFYTNREIINFYRRGRDLGYSENQLEEIIRKNSAAAKTLNELLGEYYSQEDLENEERKYSKN